MGTTRSFLSSGDEAKEREGSRALLIKPDRALAPVVLLRSYIRTAAPEFDLIFPRKEIKRKWPPGRGGRERDATRLFSRKPLKIFETVAVTGALSPVRIL